MIQILPENNPGSQKLASVNTAAKTIMKAYREAEIDSRYIAVAINNLYKDTIGIDLIYPVKAMEEKLYDLTEIADILGVLSYTGKLHKQAIGAVISKLSIPSRDKVKSPFTNKEHSGVMTRYKQSVVGKVNTWFIKNGHPEAISYKDDKDRIKTCQVIYRDL